MGQFTERVRWNKAIPLSLNNVSYKEAEYIRSWRTKTGSSDLSDEEAGTIAGIRKPKQSGDLGAVLRDRKRFTEEIMRTMNSPVRNVPTGKDITSVNDVGHPFSSVKFHTISSGRLYTYQSQTGPRTGSRLWHAEGSAFVDGRFVPTPVFPTVVATGLPTNSVFNHRMNSTFQNMRPNQEIAQIGETLVSLLRGEIPKLFKNLENAIMRHQTRERLRAAGSEYLNQVFGWAPLIRDFENAIRALLVIDNLIYGSSYRRHRKIVFDSWTTQPSFRAVGDTNYGEKPVGSFLNFPTTSQVEFSRHHTYDVRLSARLVPLARPGRGANKFIDESTDVLERLGVWYPSLGWDLLPYSWLVDWFLHLGTALNNSMTYGKTAGMVNIDYAWATSCLRVLSTAYPLHERRVRIGSTWYNLGPSPAKTLSVAKTRFTASPFGFGIDLSGLSGSQVAILTALGMVKFL